MAPSNHYKKAVELSKQPLQPNCTVDVNDVNNEFEIFFSVFFFFLCVETMRTQSEKNQPLKDSFKDKVTQTTASNQQKRIFGCC